MPQKYIVTFTDKATTEQISKAKADLTSQGGQITNEYDMPGFKGFAGVIPDSVLAEFKSLKEDGGIINGIEPDGIASTQ